jgi:hypothetical protein
MAATVRSVAVGLWKTSVSGIAIASVNSGRRIGISPVPEATSQIAIPLRLTIDYIGGQSGPQLRHPLLSQPYAPCNTASLIVAVET